jgi:hypothetical protein
MHKCDTCGGQDSRCPDCLTPERFITILQRAILEAKRTGKKKKREDLEAVLANLPRFPVMAMMEAEARNFSEEFMTTLKRSLRVREFGDQKYSDENG